MKRSVKLQKVQDPEDDECGGGNYEATSKLYGKWQLEPLHLPDAVNGIVPKVSSDHIGSYSKVQISWKGHLVNIEVNLVLYKQMSETIARRHILERPCKFGIAKQNQAVV